MNTSPHKTLALIEAACLIFRTRTPSEPQVARVQKLMQSGALGDCHCAGPPHRWTTTPAAIADYLAKESLKRTEAKYSAITGEETPAPSLFDGTIPESENDAHLKSLYKDLWSDYFLSVFLRRKSTNQSVTFRRAVLAGQVLVLAALLLTMLAGVQLTRKVVPPERRLVEQWIDDHTEYYRIDKWFPPEPDPARNGVTFRVQYTYRTDSSPRPVTTDRNFLVAGSEVSELTTAD